MDAKRRADFFRLRAVAKSPITKMLTFNELGDPKLNVIQVRFDELPNIYKTFEISRRH